MRDYVIFGIVFATLPFIFKRPVIGILAFTWISLMNPHRLTYGAAHDFPFAAIITVVTLVSLFFSQQRKRLPLNAAVVTLLVFMAWMTFTSFFALESTLAWIEWNRVVKTLFMIVIAMLAIDSEKDIKDFAWVIGLSVGFYGLKGGIFTIASGGTNHVLGPDSSYIADNNALALALVMITPMIWYLYLQAKKKWLRIGLIGLTLLTVISAAGSYSRGALLAGGAMLFFLWLKSKGKFRTGLALILIVPIIYSVMPDKWFHRMETIDDYQEDASAMGRINAWHFAMNVAEQNLIGGGYKVFTPKMFYVYAPQPQNFHAAHSIYFQVLGEHGIVGLFLFVLLLIFSWRTGTRIIQYCRDKEELKWATDLAAMCQVSIIGFAVGGAFLSMAYYDLYYDLIALLVLMEKVLIQKPSAFNNGLTAPPTGQAESNNQGRLA